MIDYFSLSMQCKKNKITAYTNCWIVSIMWFFNINYSTDVNAVYENLPERWMTKHQDPTVRWAYIRPVKAHSVQDVWSLWELR